MSLCEPCTLSSKQVSAKHFCLDCSERYCDSCAEDHGKFRAFSNHSVVTAEPAESNECNKQYNTSSDESKVVHDNVGRDSADSDGLCGGSEEFLDDEVYADAHDEEGVIDHFYVDVNNTEMSRTIGINGQRCLLIIDSKKPSISISHNSVKRFECMFSVIRSYNFDISLASFKVVIGRGGPHGEGVLIFKFNNDEIESAQACFQTIIKRHTRDKHFDKM